MRSVRLPLESLPGGGEQLQARGGNTDGNGPSPERQSVSGHGHGWLLCGSSSWRVLSSMKSKGKTLPDYLKKKSSADQVVNNQLSI